MKVVLIGPREAALGDDALEYRERLVATYEELIELGLSFGTDYTGSREFLGIECLAAVLRAEGHDVRVISCANEGLDASQSTAEVLAERPDLVGVSLLYDLQLYDALVLARSVKASDRSIHVCFGGPLAAMIPELLLSTFPFIDTVVKGEGEVAILELIEALRGQRPWSRVGSLFHRVGDAVVRNDFAAEADLDRLPFASRDVIASLGARGLPVTAAYLYTSRGCRALCTFCTVPKLVGKQARKWRSRDPVRVVDEMAAVVREHGVRTFYMADDNFLGYDEESKLRLKELAAEIQRRELRIEFHAECRVDSLDLDVLQRLRAAGFSQILLGLESGSSKTLHRWAKGQTVAENAAAIETARRLRFELVPSLILLDWESSTAEVEETVRFIENTRIYNTTYPLSLVNQLKVHCGTSAGRRYENVHGVPSRPRIEDDASLVQWIDQVTYQSIPIDDPYVAAFWGALNGETNRWAFLSQQAVPQLFLAIRKRQIPDRRDLRRACVRWRRDLGRALAGLMRLLIDRVIEHQRANRDPGDLTTLASRFVSDWERDLFPEGIEKALTLAESA